jgi:hypothetical protein
LQYELSRLWRWFLPVEIASPMLLRENGQIVKTL